MPAVGDIGLFHTATGDKPAVCCAVNLDGTVDLAILSPTIRRVPLSFQEDRNTVTFQDTEDGDGSP
jgi:hypothetical protein